MLGNTETLKPVLILPALVAERIAAGEVIERPASVVKELVENSIDAKATQIEVRIQEGGCDLIEITDNGLGMSRQDLEICVCRHATSKIHSLEDLDHLATLGFRGEALPSIAAVSDLRITSKSAATTDKATECYEIHAAHTAPIQAQSERVANSNFLGSNHGTRIRVSSLFSQIPARLKFLKSASSELNAIRDILERLAFTHPEVAIRLINQSTTPERKILDLPSETLEMRAERLLAQDNPFEMLSAKIEGAWAIQVLWLRGLSLPNMRSMIQIVNGRSLKDRTLSQAILNPLRQSFLPGHFPALVVKIDIPTDELDVNVHPTKTEVRFLDPKKIFALCSAAIQKMLSDARPTAFVASSVTGPYFDLKPTQSYSLSSAYTAPFSGSSFGGHTTITEPSGPSFSELYSAPAELEAQFDISPWGKFQGILFSTYLLFEKGTEVLLIDQHAAHERIRYEQLKKRVLKSSTDPNCDPSTIESQSLLIPEIIRLDREQLQDVTGKLPLLEKLGFDCEVFSDESILFRSIPALWGIQNLGPRLKNLLTRLEQIADLRELVWDETLFEKVAMEACRSSIKGGDHITEFAAIDLAKKLMDCEHPDNCPHGRPTFIKLNELKVEEWFSRKI
jgi:DNA mismatch repair protein MutL